MAPSRNLNVAVTGDSRDYERALARSGGATGKFVKTTTTANSRVGKSFGGMAKRAIGAGAAFAGAYASIAGAKAAISTTEDLAKATIGLHKNLGLSVEKASEWAAVARARNVDTKALNMSFGTLSKNIAASHDATSKQADLFKQLGVSQKDLKSGDFNKVLAATADGLQKMGPGADRTAASMKLFGRGWQTIVPVLRDGSKGMKEQLALADKYGVTFKGKTVKSLEDLIKAQRESKFATMGLQVAFGTQLAPVLTKVIGKTTAFVAQMRDGTGAGGRFAAKMRDVWNDLKPIVQTAKDVATWLGKHPHLLAVAGAAWAAYKTAALIQIGIVKAASLGLFGAGMRTKLAGEAGKTGTTVGRGFAAKAGLAAAAGVAGWEIGTWIRKHSKPVRDAGDWLARQFSKGWIDVVDNTAAETVKRLGQMPGIGLPTKPTFPKLPRGLKPKSPKTGRGQGGPQGTGRTSGRTASAASASGPIAHASRTFSKSELMGLWISAGGPASVADTAAAIALAESGGNPSIVNSIGAAGLWQIYGLPFRGDPLDPMTNARMAVAKYRAAGGFSPWTTYTGADTGPGGGPGPKTYLQYTGGGTKPSGATGGPGGSGGVSAPAPRKVSAYDQLTAGLDHIDLMSSAGVITESDADQRKVAAINKALPKLRGDNRLRALGTRREINQGVRSRANQRKQKAAANRATQRAARTVDTTINNPWLQAYLDHQDNLQAAGQIDAITARENKAAALEGAIGHGLSGEDALRARGMVNDLRGQNYDEISGRTVAAGQVDSVADEGVRLAHIDAQVRAGDLTPEQGRQAKIASIQDALANWVLTDDARLDLRGELKDLLDENTQAQADNTQALKDLQKSIDDQTNFAKSVAATEAGAMAQWVTEVISKQMGFGISGRALTPAYGVARRS